MGLEEIVKTNVLLPWISILAFLGTIGIEISPIKINPWSSLFKWIGRQINGEIREELKLTENRLNERLDGTIQLRSQQYDEILGKIDSNQSSINELYREIDVQGMESYRWAILKFANDIRNRIPKSKDEFMHIFDIANRYHHLIDKHNLTNGLIDTEMSLVRKRYEEHCIKNDFLA